MKLPAWLQHLLVALAGTLLYWAGSEGIPLLREQPGFGAALAALAAALLGYLAPFISSYGITMKRVDAAVDGSHDITSAGRQDGI